MCTNATSGCSGYGEGAPASKTVKSCFVCTCQTTRDKKNRSEDWAGIACKRKDVSRYVAIPLNSVYICDVQPPAELPIQR